MTVHAHKEKSDEHRRDDVTTEEAGKTESKSATKPNSMHVCITSQLTHTEFMKSWLWDTMSRMPLYLLRYVSSHTTACRKSRRQ